MRGVFVLFAGIAFFTYAVTRPADPPAQTASFTELPAAPRAAPSKSSPRERAPSSANISPQPKRQIAAKPASPPSPSAGRKTTEVLTDAAIIALIITASRNAYYSTGRPCACPEDRMRNGRRCGGNSAHDRPGGASPLCYPTDVSAEMIKSHRARLAQQQ